MKIKAKILFIISGILMISAFYLNINAFITGSTPKPVSICSSALFVVSCCCLSLMKKSRTMAAALAIYTGFIAIVSLAAFIELTCNLSTNYLILFVLIALPPFYGLTFLGGFYVWWFVLFVFSALLFIVNIYCWKKAAPHE